MRAVRIVLILLMTLLLTSCWDRREVEDQFYVDTMAIDQGSGRRYRITIDLPLVAGLEAGILGGSPMAREPRSLMTAEADSIAEAVYAMNASVSRRISMRHMRALVFGEALAREGLHHLLAELTRNHEIRQTVSVYVARGGAEAALEHGDFAGEVNTARVAEGLHLVAKQLKLSPPIRLHHLINRRGRLGMDPIAPVLAANPRILQGEEPGEVRQSALAGELQRYAGNVLEVAGTAVFRGDRLVGFFTVDESQALMALRGAMGKAYISIPDPWGQGQTLMIRFQQENLPQRSVWLTRDKPRASIRLLFEGEVMTGGENYRRIETRLRAERAAAAHMEEQARAVIRKSVEWGADPVGLGLIGRSQFPTWDAWDAYGWHEHIRELEAEVTVAMRIRRFGMIYGRKPAEH